jgi:fructose-1,6-bisphosphatase/inositol monophosphatase family enzyme
MVDYGLRVWDMAATEVLIREAGGAWVRVPSARSGREERYDVIFGKPAVVRWVLRTLGLEAGP